MAFVWSDVTIPTLSGGTLRDYAEDTGHAILCAIGGAFVLTTADCVTWTSRTPAAANDWRGVAYASTLGTAGRLCAVSVDGANRVMTSDDGGVTWTSRSASEANAWTAVDWVPWLNAGNGLFVAVASTGVHRVMTSPDGITWTNETAAAAQSWCSVSHSATAIVALSSNTGTQNVMTSTDAVTWTLQTSAPSNHRLSLATQGSSALTYAALLDMFAYCIENTATSNYKINTSTDDGVTWVLQTLPSPLEVHGGLRWLDALGLFLTPGNTGALRNYVVTSPDGVTWTEELTGIFQDWNSVGWMDSRGAVVAGGGVSDHVLTGVSQAVDALSPSIGTIAGGTVVTITGAGLGGVTSVTFGGTEAVSVIATGSSITCVTPPHAVGLVDVVVAGIGTLSNAFSFVAVTRVSPKAGTVAGSTPVTVTGFGFAAASLVLFDGVAATDVVVVSNTSITCVTPAHASGTVDVEVVGVATGTNLYTYTLAVPQLLGKGPLLPPIPTRRLS